MRLRKILYLLPVVFVTLAAILWAASLITGYTVVVVLDDPGLHITNVTVKKGEKVKILKDLDFEEGEWSAYLVLNHDDWVRLNDFDRNCYRTTDKAFLKQLKDAWEMEISGADMATVTSGVIFVKDGVPVWVAGIAIGDNIEGFQSSRLGWVEPVTPGAIKSAIKSFEPVYAPLLIL